MMISTLYHIGLMPQIVLGVVIVRTRLMALMKIVMVLRTTITFKAWTVLT